MPWVAKVSGQPRSPGYVRVRTGDTLYKAWCHGSARFLASFGRPGMYECERVTCKHQNNGCEWAEGGAREADMAPICSPGQFILYYCAGRRRLANIKTKPNFTSGVQCRGVPKKREPCAMGSPCTCHDDLGIAFPWPYTAAGDQREVFRA